MGRYIQKSGGKRVRPRPVDGGPLRRYSGDRAVLYASVVEFIHTATLVHDDIIDDADLRRGRLAVHSRWGNDITVLLGDYLTSSRWRSRSRTIRSNSCASYATSHCE